MTRWTDRNDDRGGEPQPGFYTVRLVKRGPALPAITALTDGLWSTMINGVLLAPPHADPFHAGVYTVWHGGQRSDAVEHAYLSAVRNWALVHQPGHPLCHPRKPIDVGALPPVLPL